LSLNAPHACPTRPRPVFGGFSLREREWRDVLPGFVRLPCAREDCAAIARSGNRPRCLFPGLSRQLFTRSTFRSVYGHWRASLVCQADSCPSVARRPPCLIWFLLTPDRHLETRDNS